MVILLLNADEYLASLRLAELKAGLGDPEMAGLNTVEINATGQTDAAQILAEASLMPFLAAKRLVLVRGILDNLDKRLAASKSPDSAAHLAAAQLLTRISEVPETCDLVFVDNTVDKRRSLWKGFAIPAARELPERKIPGLEALIKQGIVQAEQLAAPDAKLLPGWIQDNAQQRGIKIGGDAVALLARYVGPNLRQLDNELEKLSLYADKRTITARDVQAMVSDASEEKIWNLTDGMCQRNPRAAMRALHELRRGEDQSPIGILASMAKQYRLLILVKSCTQQGGTAESIAQRLGEKPFSVQKAMGVVGRYSYQQLEEIMDRLLEADMAMKTGANQDTELDLLVAELTKKPA